MIYKRTVACLEIWKLLKKLDTYILMSVIVIKFVAVVVIDCD